MRCITLPNAVTAFTTIHHTTWHSRCCLLPLTVLSHPMGRRQHSYVANTMQQSALACRKPCASHADHKTSSTVSRPLVLNDSTAWPASLLTRRMT